MLVLACPCCWLGALLCCAFVALWACPIAVTLLVLLHWRCFAGVLVLLIMIKLCVVFARLGLVWLVILFAMLVCVSWEG